MLDFDAGASALLHKRLRGPNAAPAVENETEMRAKHEKHLSDVREYYEHHW